MYFQNISNNSWLFENSLFFLSLIFFKFKLINIKMLLYTENFASLYSSQCWMYQTYKRIWNVQSLWITRSEYKSKSWFCFFFIYFNTNNLSYLSSCRNVTICFNNIFGLSINILADGQAIGKPKSIVVLLKFVECLVSPKQIVPTVSQLASIIQFIHHATWLHFHGWTTPQHTPSHLQQG